MGANTIAVNRQSPEGRAGTSLCLKRYNPNQCNGEGLTEYAKQDKKQGTWRDGRACRGGCFGRAGGFRTQRYVPARNRNDGWRISIKSQKGHTTRADDGATVRQDPNGR